jgi:hypothetical protein
MERESLHYHLQMKKPNLTKLTVRRNTIRALTSAEFARAGGGDPAILFGGTIPDRGCLATEVTSAHTEPSATDEDVAQCDRSAS